MAAERRSVLMVEDDQHLIELMVEELTGRGFDVSVAKTASAAVDLLDGGHYDVLLCDFDLGVGGCGMDVIEMRPDGTATILWSGDDRTKEVVGGIAQGRWTVSPERIMSKLYIRECLDEIERERV